MDIDDNGQVKYKGKAIDHYFVEGMDVTGGRYSQINNNLSAKAVKSAEIMENYQSVKALKGKLSSDEIALNLKLDPQARDQWIINGTWVQAGVMEHKKRPERHKRRGTKERFFGKTPPMPSNWVKASKASTATRATTTVPTLAVSNIY